jgi:hypothetical protein
MPMSSKLRFARVARKRGAIAKSRRAKQSFGDKGVPKQELGHDGNEGTEFRHEKKRCDQARDLGLFSEPDRRVPLL